MTLPGPRRPRPPSNHERTWLAAPATEPPLLSLQRAAGNKAVSHLLGAVTVQRFWPFDDEEEGEEPGEDEGEEEVPKNPQEIPNVPADAGVPVEGMPQYGLPDPAAAVQFLGGVSRGGVQVTPVPLTPGAMVELSKPVAMAYARSLPYEPIPPDTTVGAGMMLANAETVLVPPQDPVVRQLFRAWAGVMSPDIARIAYGAGAQGPGTGSPGGGAATPGGIPGMEPVTPGGGAGPAEGIPGMEPVTPGGGASTGLPGLEPVPPGGAGGGPGPASARPMLRLGSAGDAVRDAQDLLVRHGASIDPDGQFGPATQRAVIEFQRSAGLSPDGIVGPQTWGALQSS